jgi:hypothetical protein
MINSTFFLRLLLTFLLLCPVALGQNQKRQIMQREQLRTLMSGVGVDLPPIDAWAIQFPIYRQVKLDWADSAKSTSEPTSEAQTQAPKVSIVQDWKRSGTLPRQRSLELAPTLMFVAAVDASNKLRWWSIMPDPRVVRSETQTATGELRSQDYYFTNVIVVVAFPDDPEIATLRFYHPVWNGTNFDLKPLTVVSTR